MSAADSRQRRVPRPAGAVILLFLTATALLCAASACAGRKTALLSAQPDAAQSAEISRADALAQLAALPLPEGADPHGWLLLKDRLARALAQLDALRPGGSQLEDIFTPGPPLHVNSRCTDISAEHADGGLLLDWAYTSWGDYDHNSEVNAADLAPVGAGLSARPSHPQWARHRLADGDANTEVNAADIAPIAGSFVRRVDSYMVEHASSPAGPFSALNDVPFSAAYIPAGEFGKRFSYADANAQPGWYRVVPYFAGAPGIPSDAAEYNPPNALPQLSLICDWQAGFPPFTTRFSAEGSFDPDGSIVEYHWDLNGDGTFELNTGTDTEASQEYSAEGETQVTLRAVDNRGGFSQTQLSIYAVGWRFVKLSENSSGPPICRVGVNNGKPVAVWTESDVDPAFGPFYIKIACATTPSPASLADFVVSEIRPEGTGTADGDYSIGSINGKPAVLFGDGKFDQMIQQPRTYKLALARVEHPETSADWMVSEVFSLDAGMFDHQSRGPVFEVNGRPAYFSVNSRENNCRFYLSAVAEPTGPADWQFVELGQPSPDGTFPHELWGISASSHSAGELLLCYTEDTLKTLRLARTTSAAPLSMADWELSEIGNHSEEYGWLGLHRLRDKPLLLAGFNTSSRDYWLHVYKGVAPLPQQPNDWQREEWASTDNRLFLNFEGKLAIHPAHFLPEQTAGDFFAFLITEWQGELLQQVQSFPLPTGTTSPLQYFLSDSVAPSGGYFLSRHRTGGSIKEIWLGLPSIAVP